MLCTEGCGLCNALRLQCVSTHCNKHFTEGRGLCGFTRLRHTSTHCTTLHHTATHCNTLQHTATHCNTLQHTAPHCNTLQHTIHRGTRLVRWFKTAIHFRIKRTFEIPTVPPLFSPTPYIFLSLRVTFSLSVCVYHSLRTIARVMSHVKNEACPHTRTRPGSKASKNDYEWVTSHVWMNHVVCMNESMYEWVLSRVWMCHITYT